MLQIRSPSSLGGRALPTTEHTDTSAHRRVRAHQLHEQRRQQQRRPVAGRKTFTGCWTCRARKRKCDEAFPHCHQCTKKNLVCEGYSARLQWLPCELAGPGAGPAAPVRTVSAQRRQISFSIPSAVFDDAELDRLLLALDDAAAAPAPGRTTLRGPFGVFPAQDAGAGMPAQMAGQTSGPPADPSGLYPNSIFSPSTAFAQVLDQQQQHHHHHPHPHPFPVLPAVAPGDLDVVFGGGSSHPGGDGTSSVPMAWNNMDDMWASLTLGSMLLQQQQQQQHQPASPGGSPGSNSFGAQLSLFDLLEHDPAGPAVAAVAGQSPHELARMDGDDGVGVEETQAAEEGESAVVEEEEEDALALDVSQGASQVARVLRPAPPGPERPLTPASFLLQPKMRFLLSHYVQHVVNSFCISTRATRSPWKSIHLPRALQGSGELAVMGATSHARRALLHALLAVSAFCLANQYAAGGGRAEDAVARWRKVGSQLRLQVLSALRRGLAESLAGGTENPSSSVAVPPPTAYSAVAGLPDADDQLDSFSLTSSSLTTSSMTTALSLANARPKYKELLAAMLSMVSVDVASGDTATTRTHLLGCESLIRSARAWKRHYSAKARALHRIFYYLRVIYASTNLVDTFEEDVEEGEDKGENTDDDKSPPLPPPPPRPKGTRAWLEETLLERSETAASCEFIYGVPASLLILLARVTDHVRRLDRLASKTDGGGGGGGRRASVRDGTTATASSPHEAALAAESDRLEAEVLTFPVDALLAEQDQQDNSAETLDRAILQHQTRAFHQALVLYFCQNIRAMHALHLRPYVEAVLRHAEAIEAIKRRHGVPSSTLFWPCFVAASEAVDAPLQQRFLRWYETAFCAGFAGCLRGRDIVAEVWRRRRAGWPRARSTWRAVVASQNACLMLT